MSFAMHALDLAVAVSLSTALSPHNLLRGDRWDVYVRGDFS